MNANKSLPGQRFDDGSMRSLVWTVSFLALLIGTVILPAILTVQFDLPVLEAVRLTVGAAGVAYSSWLIVLFR